MQKVIVINVIALLLSFQAMAQDKKVAVFDPAGTGVDGAIKEIVREEISSIIVNTGGYTVLERQLINKVLEENKFQTGGLVDDTQISEIGKRMGANLVMVSSITSLGSSNSNLYISCKLIDVQTARIEKQRTAQTQKGSGDLIPVIQRVAKEMFEVAAAVAVTPQQPFNNQPADWLDRSGRKVYQEGERLSKNEVRRMMWGTKALQYYERGMSLNKAGNITALAGAGMILFWVVDNTVQMDILNDYNPYTNDYYASSLGLAVIGVGITAIVGGTVLKLVSKSSVKKAVDMYNNNRNTAMELNFGFTGNGVSLALRF